MKKSDLILISNGFAFIALAGIVNAHYLVSVIAAVAALATLFLIGSSARNYSLFTRETLIVTIILTIMLPLAGSGESRQMYLAASLYNILLTGCLMTLSYKLLRQNLSLILLTSAAMVVILLCSFFIISALAGSTSTHILAYLPVILSFPFTHTTSLLLKKAARKKQASISLLAIN